MGKKEKKAGKTILFADDESWLNTSMVEILRENDYNVETVENGTAAVEYLESERPVDLVILDIMMPSGERVIDPAYGRRTGVKVGEYIRRTLNLRVPIIYFTVIQDQSVHNQIMKTETEAGQDPRIMVKPVSPSELLDAIENCIGLPEM